MDGPSISVENAARKLTLETDFALKLLEEVAMVKSFIETT
jgi:hypothetical protein